MLRRTAQLAWRILYARYLLTSAIALGADLTIFLLSVQMKMPAVLASVAGYVFGLGVHWLLSSRLVFVREPAATVSKLIRQKALFIASALGGLVITAAIVKCGIEWRIDPSYAKLIAIIISFQATYFLRRTIVFP